MQVKKWYFSGFNLLGWQQFFMVLVVLVWRDLYACHLLTASRSGKAPSVDVFQRYPSRIQVYFEENHRKLRTAKSMSVSRFESGTFHVPTFRTNAVRSWGVIFIFLCYLFIYEISSFLVRGFSSVYLIIIFKFDFAKTI